MAVTFQIVEDVLDGIKSELDTVFDALGMTVEVMKDSDETTQDRVLEIAANGPAALVAWAGTESGAYSAKKKSTDRFAIGVWAAPTSYERVSSLEVASQIARVVANTVLGNDWGVDGVGKAADYQCDNMTGGIPDAEGYALLVLTWSQELDFPDAVDPSTLEDLTSVYSTAKVPGSPDGETKDEFSTTISQE
jgi:hypothetical protein